MLLSAVTTTFRQLSFLKCLDLFADAGISGVEISVGGFSGAPHVETDKLLSSKIAREKFIAEFKRRNLKIAALACHCNPLHPDPAIGKKHQSDMRKAIRLAESLEVGVVVTLSGCPGADKSAKHPTWIASAWPEEFRQIVKWQWEKIAAPYWSKLNDTAAGHGVRIAVEMHPSNLVYNPATLIKLRTDCGRNIGANIDPSHLLWQGIDPAVASEYLRDAVYHVHAKDASIDRVAVSVNGILDGATVVEGIPRTWFFAVPGQGHHKKTWSKFINALKAIKFKGAVSIEHEARLIDPVKGLYQAANFLKPML